MSQSGGTCKINFAKSSAGRRPALQVNGSRDFFARCLGSVANNSGLGGQAAFLQAFAAQRLQSIRRSRNASNYSPKQANSWGRGEKFPVRRRKALRCLGLEPNSPWRKIRIGPRGNLAIVLMQSAHGMAMAQCERSAAIHGWPLEKSELSKSEVWRKARASA